MVNIMRGMDKMAHITVCDKCGEDTKGHYWIIKSNTLCDKCYNEYKSVHEGKM